ncbi:M1 family metallopeptidase [Reichenbachiella versicolor]|uniref:M1 family metallopeptidase n=1 Tax=Reichenbachiella versicolor TaxID=1821036 RepID=UPI000D6DE190|nr:M1 family metallopeptidase [Reichenbachiella versicolor]
MRSIQNSILFLFLVLSLTVFISKGYTQENEELSAVYRGSETNHFDLIHTELKVSFDWENETMQGEALLFLKPYYYEQTRLVLDAKMMVISKVMVNGRSMNYQYDSLNLAIDLDRPVNRFDTLEVNIDYTAHPNLVKTKGDGVITEDKGLYFIKPSKDKPNKPFQIWTQGETESSSVWFPTIDTPNQRCTQEIQISVQDKYRTLSNGILINPKASPDQSGIRTDIWKMDQPHAPYLFMMAIGEYATVKDTWNDIELEYIVEPEYEAHAKAIFGHTPEMIEYFSELLDYPFPWQKYSQVVVRDFVSGAMENTTASVFMEGVQATRRELIDFNWDDIIAHELFHQWFGDLVTCESWSNLTLNEGFASYSEYLWAEYKYGIDEAQFELLNSREAYFTESYDSAKSLIRYYYDSRNDLFDTHSYNKGAAVLHMLRGYLGDQAFFAGVHHYLKKNEYQSVEVADLRLAFEELLGEDLHWFFDQWYFTPGHPIIDVTHEYKDGTLTITAEQYSSVGMDMVYELPLFIDITVEGIIHRHSVVMTNGLEVYTFKYESEPELVVFDGDRYLLAEINHDKSELELLEQMKNKSDLYGRIQTIDSLPSFKSKKIIKSIVEMGLEDPYPTIKQRTLNYLSSSKLKIDDYKDRVTLLLKDSSSEVRASAVNYVGQVSFEEYKQFITKAIGDSSYMVAGAALTQFQENGQQLHESVFKNFALETNINIVLALAPFVNEKEDDFVFPWYSTKFKQLKNSEIYFLLQLYAEKLISAPTKFKEIAVGQLYHIATTHAQYGTKLSAYQTLMLISDTNGAEQAMEDIRKNESDPELINWYESNQLF